MNDRTLSFLRDSSDRTLQDFELMKRANAANLAKELRGLLNQIVDELAEAETARIWREQRKPLHGEGRPQVTVDVLRLGFDE